MSDRSDKPTIGGSEDAAKAAGLAYATISDPGLTRRRAGNGFSYRDAKGVRITDRTTLDRIRALAIPPAWTEVWVCPDPHGHIQAVGQDEKGRKQYLYHAKFREIRDRAKFEHMIAFADALPRLRHQVSVDMRSPGLGRAKVLATVVHLLETTMIRVGNASYAKDNKSYGLTTLRARHLRVEGSDLRFHFKGKSGKIWRLSVRDRRIAKIVKTCQELPGQSLFQYCDREDLLQTVTSGDVNAYLKEISGADISAKDFRTWTGTVLAAVALAELGPVDTKALAKKNVARAIERVATRLGNTPTTCRNCYVHPEIVAAYLDGHLSLEFENGVGDQPGDDQEALRPEEAAVLSLLRNRARRDRSGASAAALR